VLSNENNNINKKYIKMKQPISCFEFVMNKKRDWFIAVAYEGGLVELIDANL
jgi:hypothetical protein